MTIVTPPPPEVPFGALFAASWRLFSRNWIVALPPVLAAIAGLAALCAYVAALVGIIGVAGVRALASSSSSHPPDAFPTAALVSVGLIGGAVVAVVSIALALWSVTATYGMANAAWERGVATFGDGFAAFRTRGGAVFVAGIGICLLAVAAVVLALPTLFLSLIALTLVTIFVMPATVGGGRGGFDAIGDSFRLIRRFFVPSLITWLVLYAIQYGIGFLTGFAIIPLEMSAMPATPEGPPVMPPLPLILFSGVMYLVSLVLLMGYTGFRAMVEVGLYRELQSRGAALASQPQIVLPSA